MQVSEEFKENAVIQPGETRIFFIGVKLSSSSYDSISFRAEIEVFGDTSIVEDFTGIRQSVSERPRVITPDIEPVKEANFDWDPVDDSELPIRAVPEYDFLSGKAFSGSDDGRVRAVSNEGAALWTYDAEGKVQTGITQVNDSVYFGDAGGYVHSLRKNDGIPEWKRHLGGRVNAVVFPGNYLYAVNSEGIVYKMDPETGDDIPGFSGQLSGDLTGAPAVVEDWRGVSALWASSESGNVYRLQLQDGTVTSNFTSAESIYTSPIVDSGRYDSARETNFLFIGSDDGKVYCRTAGNLSTIPEGWRNRPGHPDGAFDTGAPVRTNIWKCLYGDSLYFGNEAGRLYALDKLTGTLIWDEPFQAEGAVRTVPVMLRGNHPLIGIGEGEDYIYFGDSRGYFYAVSVHDGESIREGFPVFLGAAVTSNFVIGTDGATGKLRCMVGTADGRFHAINIGP